MQYQCASLLRTKPCCVTGVLSANLLSGWRVSSSVRPQTCCSAFESTWTEKLPEASMLPDASARKARASAVCAPSESISARSLRSSSCAIWASCPRRTCGLHQVVQAVLAAEGGLLLLEVGIGIAACN